MGIPPTTRLTFAIDDALSVDENIAAFAKKLNISDPQLANILTPSLTKFSNEEISIDQGALLDALYAATAPVAETNSQNDGASE